MSIDRRKFRRLARRHGTLPRKDKAGQLVDTLPRTRLPLRRALYATAAALLVGGALNIFIPSDKKQFPVAPAFTLTVRAPWTAEPLSGLPDNFLGNPNAYWSSIDTSGGIVTSRDDEIEGGIITLYVPGFIHVSASGIDGVGEIRFTDGTANIKQNVVPYSDLEFGWDFGDPTGTETFTNVGTGRVNAKGGTVNANDRQWGGEAVYCYRNPAPGGTIYTITLTIRAKFSNSSFITTTVTKQVRVKPFTEHPKYTQTLYMDFDSGDDSWTGLLPEPNAGTAPDWTGATDGPIQTNIGLAGKYSEGTRIAIKRDTTPTAVIKLSFANNNVSISHIRWTSYSMDNGDPIFPGVGTTPKFLTSSGFIAFRNYDLPDGQDGAMVQDVVFGNFDIEVVGNAARSAVFTLDRTDLGEYKNMYWDNITGTCADIENTVAFAIHPILSRLGHWNCSYDSELGPDTPGVGEGPMAYTARYFHFEVGGSRSSNLPLHEMSHLEYTSTQDHYLNRWLSYIGGAGGAYAMNGNCDFPDGEPGPGEFGYASYHCFSECRISAGGFAGFDFGAWENGYFIKVVFERCTVHDIGNIPEGTGTGNFFIWAKSLLEFTVRDCEMWALNVTSYIVAGTDASVLSVIPSGTVYTSNTDPPKPVYKYYRNKHHRKAGTLPVSALLATGWTCQYTDNECMDERDDGGIAGFGDFALLEAYGAMIDRSRYYHPNYAERKVFRYLNGETVVESARTLTEFNTDTHDAYDQNPPTNGGTTTSDPGWPNPGAGDFGTSYAA